MRPTSASVCCFCGSCCCRPYDFPPRHSWQVSVSVSPEASIAGMFRGERHVLAITSVSNSTDCREIAVICFVHIAHNA